MPGRSTRRLRRELGFTVLGISRHLRCPKVSKGRAESPLLIATHGNFAVRESLAGGTDAPTPARTVGLPSRGGQYFLSTRKKVPKKASGTATTGKSPLLPILTAGLATSRAISLASYLLRSRALLCSPFSAVKMGGLFSLRCLTPLCSLAVGTGRTQIAVLGSYSAAWRLRSAEKQTLFFPLQLAQGMLNQCQLGCCDMP